MFHSRLISSSSLFSTSLRRFNFTSVRFPRKSTVAWSNRVVSHAPRVRFNTGTIENEQVERLYERAGEDRAISRWLFTCAGLVFGMVVVGGITRLTESGLSMVEWKPIVGAMPPMNEEAWQEEFDKYKQYPEYKKQNFNMTLAEFKQIFFWEWAHRFYGRAIGIAFAVPFGYFLLRRRIPTKDALKLTGIFGLGGLQGLIGWWMVKSGLKDTGENNVARVSHLRLATHLGSAFLIYCLLLWEAMNWRRRIPKNLPKGIAPLKTLAMISTAFVSTTAMSGALVAGLDAGLIYNEFPLMGNQFFPSDGLNLEPKWRNFVFNEAAVQFNHRYLALTTVAIISGTFYVARRGGAHSLYNQLHREGRLALHSLMGGVVVQACLGITTLLLFVPVPLGAAHQAGSLTVLSFSVWLLHNLRKAKVIK